MVRSCPAPPPPTSRLRVVSMIPKWQVRSHLLEKAEREREGDINDEPLVDMDGMEVAARGAAVEKESPQAVEEAMV